MALDERSPIIEEFQKLAPVLIKLVEESEEAPETVADLLYEIQDVIREIQTVETAAMNKLQSLLAARITEDDDKPRLTGSYGQVYGIQYDKNTYKIKVPKSELDELGLGSKLQYKLTKTLMDKYLKEGLLSNADIARWEEKKWYSIENNGGMSVRQYKSDESALESGAPSDPPGAYDPNEAPPKAAPGEIVDNDPLGVNEPAAAEKPAASVLKF